MSRDADKITLGSGRLWINNVEVGYLKGDVEFVYTREKIDFKPSGVLGPVIQHVISENAELRASIAEFDLANIKYALGVTQTIDTSHTGDPSYNPASFSSLASTTYETLTFGGDTSIDDDLAIRFEHIRPSTVADTAGKKVVVILYKAVSLSDLTLAFHDEDYNLTNVAFRGLAVATRPAGDQIGMVIEQSSALS